MKIKSILLLFMLFITIGAKCQTITLWEAKASRIYKIKLSEKIIEINIETNSDKYSYQYRLLQKNGKQYFEFEGNKMCITEKKNVLYINYCIKKLRESVNEIVGLAFKRQK